MSRLHNSSRGFTLVEAILTVVVIGSGLVGLMVLYHNTTRGAMEGDLTIAATFLARERLEQVIADKVNYGYDYVTQNQHGGSQVITLGPRSYTRICAVTEVSKNDFQTVQAGSGYKRITSTAQWGVAATERIILTTLLAEY